MNPYEQIRDLAATVAERDAEWRALKEEVRVLRADVVRRQDEMRAVYDELAAAKREIELHKVIARLTKKDDTPPMPFEADTMSHESHVAPMMFTPSLKCPNVPDWHCGSPGCAPTHSAENPCADSKAAKKGLR